MPTSDSILAEMCVRFRVRLELGMGGGEPGTRLYRAVAKSLPNRRPRRFLTTGLRLRTAKAVKNTGAD